MPRATCWGYGIAAGGSGTVCIIPDGPTSGDTGDRWRHAGGGARRACSSHRHRLPRAARAPWSGSSGVHAEACRGSVGAPEFRSSQRSLGPRGQVRSNARLRLASERQASQPRVAPSGVRDHVSRLPLRVDIAPLRNCATSISSAAGRLGTRRPIPVRPSLAGSSPIGSPITVERVVQISVRRPTSPFRTGQLLHLFCRSRQERKKCCTAASITSSLGFS